MSYLTPKSRFINANSRVPKYRQVANTILWEIEQENLKPGHRLPSINETSAEYYLSRDTIVKAYYELAHRGIITSIPGKGFYVNTTPEKAVLKIVLILNKLSHYKQEVHQAMVKKLGEETNTTIFIHNHDASLFQSFILENLGFYDYYVIMPHFNGNQEQARKAIAKIPNNKLILLDQDIDGLNPGYGLVYQDYQRDLENTLSKAQKHLAKYKKIYLVYPSSRQCSGRIIKGFKAFCNQSQMDHEILEKVNPSKLEKDCVYLVIEESDLLKVIKTSQKNQWELGQDLGIIAYNDSPCKEILAGGISVITTDHRKMGVSAADMILNRNRKKLHNPFIFKKRASL
ncbi:MAG: GntR family transcriptional regulator [Bacteroidetes bacterium]|nr:GntR family transcriptional regulator [Bacteroidota bacterium]